MPTTDNGIEQLLRRVSAHIGSGCFQYTDFLLSRRALSPLELDVLSLVFTSKHSIDSVVEKACLAAERNDTESVTDLLETVLCMQDTRFSF